VNILKHTDDNSFEFKRDESESNKGMMGVGGECTFYIYTIAEP
jgi:hypothetical protein